MSDHNENACTCELGLPCGPIGDATPPEPAALEEDPGTCMTCGTPWQLVRPGKSQPNCGCDGYASPAHDHIIGVTEHGDRVYAVDAPEPAPKTYEDRVWMVERRRTRPDGTTGEWRAEYYHRGATPPDDPSTEYFERRIVEFVPAALLASVADEARAAALEEAARAVSHTRIHDDGRYVTAVEKVLALKERT